MLARFLELLAREMLLRPQGLKAVDTAWLEKMRGLVAGTDIDLDAALGPEDQ